MLRKEKIMTVLERFLKYIKIDTASSSLSEETPSTPNQRLLANKLQEELTSLGAEVKYDE